MPLVVFESSTSPALEVSAPLGGRLVDVCDERRAAVPFSCRSASCGMCRIEVLDGGELLEPARTEELEVLRAFGDDPVRRRLACQVRICAGGGTVRVRPADD